MGMRTVVVDGVERVGGDTLLAGPLTAELSALIGDRLAGAPWSVSMTTLAELSGWIALQLQAGADAVGGAVDAGYAVSGVQPSVQVPGDEGPTPGARGVHERYSGHDV